MKAIHLSTWNLLIKDKFHVYEKAEKKEKQLHPKIV